MTEGKVPKTGAERAREYRERHKPQPVENPDFVTFRDEIRDEIVTLRNEIRNEIAAGMSEIVTILRESSPLGPPLEGSLRGESSLPGKNRNASRNENDRNENRNADRPWTNSFVARPGEIPRCPDCEHLIVNCQCDWERDREQREHERLDLA